MVKIFIGNLPEAASSEELRARFEQFGRVDECDVISNFGFVHMDVMSCAERAIASINGSVFAGNTIHVELSHGKKTADRGGPGWAGRGGSHAGGRGRGAGYAMRGSPRLHGNYGYNGAQNVAYGGMAGPDFGAGYGGPPPAYYAYNGSGVAFPGYAAGAAYGNGIYPAPIYSYPNGYGGPAVSAPAGYADPGQTAESAAVVDLLLRNGAPPPVHPGTSLADQYFAGAAAGGNFGGAGYPNVYASPPPEYYPQAQF